MKLITYKCWYGKVSDIVAHVKISGVGIDNCVIIIEIIFNLSS